VTLDVLSLLFASLILAGLFALVRQMERWLHQHLFKVGWLLTHNFQTTTILYYTIFLPGVFIHELSLWLMAGALNVRADGQIKMPDAQEIGELRLNFVKLAPRIGALKRAVISTTPLVVGLLLIWWIAHNHLRLDDAVEIMRSGQLDALGQGLSLLWSASDFGLWAYIIFTISNTMFPSMPKDLQGCRSVWLGIGAALVLAFFIGIGYQLYAALAPILANLIFSLQLLMVVTIGVDLVVVAFLALAENTIERITGHSATFRRGKMIVMRREEVLAEQERERDRHRPAASAGQRLKPAESGLNSIYELRFSVPVVANRDMRPSLGQMLEPVSQPPPKS